MQLTVDPSSISAGELEAQTRRALATNQWMSIMVTEGFNGAARRLHKSIYTVLHSCVSFFLFMLSDLSRNFVLFANIEKVQPNKAFSAFVRCDSMRALLYHLPSLAFCQPHSHRRQG